MNHSIALVNRVVDAVLIFLIFFSALFFGAVHVWSETTAIILCLAVSLLAFLGNLNRNSPENSNTNFPLYIASGCFLFIILLQLIPLPPFLIQYLSPSADRLFSTIIDDYNNVTMASSHWRSLSVYPTVTKFGGITYLALFAVFFTVVREIRDKERIQKIFLALAVCGTIEALYGLYGYFSHDFYLFQYRMTYGQSASGTFINRNHFAAFLGMTCTCTIGYLYSRCSHLIELRNEPRRRILHFLNSRRAPECFLLLGAVLIMMLAIVFSLSRMGVFSFCAALLFMLLLTSIGRGKKFSFFILIVLYLGLLTVLWYGIEPLEERYRTTIVRSRELRTLQWEATTKYIEDYPLTGSGLGTYSDIYRYYKPVQVKLGRFLYEHAHNDYLEMMAETGIPGFAFLLFGGLYLFLFILRRWFKRRNHFVRGTVLGGMGAMVYIFLHSFSDFNMHVTANSITFFIICAVIYRGVRIEEIPHMKIPAAANSSSRKRLVQRPGIRSISIALILSGIFIYAGYLLINRWRADRIYPVDRTSLIKSTPEDIPDAASAKKLKEAIRIYDANDRYHILLGKYYTFRPPSGDETPERRRQRLKQGEIQFQKSLQLNPSRIEALAYTAWIDFLRGRPLRALEKLNTAIRLAPDNYFLHVIYGTAIITFFDRFPDVLHPFHIIRARKSLIRAISLNKDLRRQPQILITLSSVYLKEGNNKGAVNALKSIQDRSISSLPLELRLAELYLQTGLTQNGLATYHKLLSTRENNSKARIEIIQSLRRSEKRHPQFQQLKILLADAYFQSDRMKEALRFLTPITLTPGISAKEIARGFYIRGLIFDRLGKPNAALGSFEEALRYDRNNKEVAQKVLEHFRNKK